MDIVRDICGTTIIGNPIWILQSKFKMLGRRLSLWSREQIGDIHENTVKWETKLQSLEELDIQINTEQSIMEVNEAHAEYLHWMKLQDTILTQKSQCKWFEEGDNNTKYFHNILREKRRKFVFTGIKNSRGHWISGDEKISIAAIKHFHHLFNLPTPSINPSIFDNIPNMVSLADNDRLSQLTDEQEIKEAIFSLSTSSAAGPDGCNGTFFQSSLGLHQGGHYCLCTRILQREKAYQYSVIINGARFGFFSFSQGLKQGDPLSPFLFILAAEVLSRSLNSLTSHRGFIPFTMPSNCPTINHLAYVDDIVIFSSRL
ncbi:uncharacterized protein LOC132034772 [Lycium ferocissimum]|uniref:uncharacterized protein LOC132034772 n=1 Tax=Lycium ferocissimum TaxID=112874 RepID=UPI002814C195|nr:uncharacterized protein LOC132034772 [Lycium ferocissimum]